MKQDSAIKANGRPTADDQPQGVQCETLVDENHGFAVTGGRSEDNRQYGFAPAFLDTRTGKVYRSRFADGRPAPIHLVEGLPTSLLVQPTAHFPTPGEPARLKPTVSAGFVQRGLFYTREQAAKAVTEFQSTDPQLSEALT
jgi:hypothetical protein